jgi:hypothetical protein
VEKLPIEEINVSRTLFTLRKKVLVPTTYSLRLG